jgi:hypothetical protein
VEGDEALVMKALLIRVLVLAVAVVLFTPGLVRAQGGGSIGVSGSNGVMGISGGNTISGSTVQGSTSSLGNAANSAAQGLKGQNVNANLNTNQNTTGINIGSINAPGGNGDPAGYSGSVDFASPSQYIGFGSSTSVNLPQLPGFIGIPSNFSQPYKPDLWVNGPGPIVPSTLTLTQADECRSSWISSNWDGGERPAAQSIELIWPSLGQKFPTLTSPTGYLGTSKAKASEKYSFMATVCQAAYEAMKKGATKGVVTFVIRPKNKSSGVGFGGSSGATGLGTAVAATQPYAMAGALGFGTGWAQAFVEGELMMHIVGLRETTAEAPKTPAATANAKPQPVADKPRDDVERARGPVADKPWFGATGQQPAQAAPKSPAPQTPNGAPAEDASAPAPATQQVAERPQEQPAPQRVPAAEKAWFGGAYGPAR